MNELVDLYQEIILDHNRRPRNFGPLAGANRDAEGYNPLCGDRVKLHLRVEDDTIEEVAFEGSGCAISTASASMLTEVLRGRTVAEAEALAERMIAMVMGTTEVDGDTRGDQADQAATGGDDLGPLVALAGVRDYPARVKCATLAWHALKAALARKGAA